jgi:flavin-dependent dehydrogenase
VGHAAEVVVVGGGVAGAAVAMLLARRGISVLVLERSAKYVDHVYPPGKYRGIWILTRPRWCGPVEGSDLGRRWASNSRAGVR